MKSGFTLIELLIVVAIIAVLSAIALPNFLEAQTRAKVSRVKADFRSVGVAIEAYRIDYAQYPLVDIGDLIPNRPKYQRLRATTSLSSPVAYISQAYLVDPFRLGDIPGNPATYYQITSGDEFSFNRSRATTENIGADRYSLIWPRNVYAVVSAGPDHRDDSYSAGYPFSYCYRYDPTNGTISRGDVPLCGPGGKTPRGWKSGDESAFTQTHPF